MKFGQWLGLIAAAAALVLLWSLRDVVIHLFAAVVLAMALCTLVGVVRARLGCARPLALLLSLFGLLVLLAIALAAVVPPFVQQFQQLLLQLPEAASKALALLRQAHGSEQPDALWPRSTGLAAPELGVWRSGSEAVGQSLQGLWA